MTTQTLHQAYTDTDLRNRVTSAIAKETWANPEFGDSPAGLEVKEHGPGGFVEYFIWPVAIDYEADYAFAVDSGVERPGNDPGVISDEELQAAVQGHWPADWTPPP